MKSNISNFITSLKAEHIKKRGTGFYYTAAVLGGIAPLLFFIVFLITRTEEIKTELPFNYYFKFIENTLHPFASFFFPLMIIIITSRITQLDHKNGGWQLMETQPILKFSIYFSKFCTVLIANVISIVSFILVSLLSAWIIRYTVPIPKIAVLDFPFAEILHISTRLFLASLLITSIQFVLSVVLSSFIWSVLIGFFGLLLTVFLQPFNLVPAWYPYQILSKIADTSTGSDLDYWFTFTEYISVTVSSILLYIGYNWYRHKTLKSVFNKRSKIIALAAVLLVFGGLTYWLLSPNQMADYDKTVFCGKIESNENFHTIYIKDNAVQDTIAVIPITNNEFHYVFSQNVVTDNYTFIIDSKYNGNLFFGKRDSIYLQGKIAGSASEFKLMGTRLAENQMNSEPTKGWSMISYYLEQNSNLDKPEILIKQLHKEWESEMEAANKFATMDNYIPKNDYTERNQKLITARYLNMWHRIVKARAALYPNEKTNGGNKIAEIQKKLSLTDESLLSNSDYFDYVKSQLIAENKQDLDEDTKAILAISKLKNSAFKDKMLFWQINKNIEEANSSKERNQFVARYNPLIRNERYHKKIDNLNKIAESLAKGKTAPNFEATSIDRKKVTLAQLKGKFVLIDIWATWCAPCRLQSPFFEKIALKYKKENIQFVALSTDENLQKWYISAKSKSKSVMQWHTNNRKQFASNYDLETIPRFILIDPNGNFINAKLPNPSEPSFEILLRKALNLPEEG